MTCCSGSPAGAWRRAGSGAGGRAGSPRWTTSPGASRPYIAAPFPAKTLAAYCGTTVRRWRTSGRLHPKHLAPERARKVCHTVRARTWEFGARRVSVAGRESPRRGYCGDCESELIDDALLPCNQLREGDHSFIPDVPAALVDGACGPVARSLEALSSWPGGRQDAEPGIPGGDESSNRGGSSPGVSADLSKSRPSGQEKLDAPVTAGWAANLLLLAHLWRTLRRQKRPTS